MTCNRLDDDGLLIELGGELNRHIEQCPDCSARVRGYEHIASWIAEGRTSHRASADWRRRTLALLRASPSPARPSESVSEVEVLAASPPVTSAPAKPVGADAIVAKAPRRRRWMLAALPIVSTAAIAAIVVTATRRGDDRAEVIGLREPKDIVAPPAPAIGPAMPHQLSPEPSGTRRGAPVIVDWDQTPADPAEAPGYITIDSDPAYVDIYIDGKSYGQPPLIRLALPPGRHVVRAVLGSGGSRSVPIVIESGKGSVFRMEMPHP